MYVMIIDLVTKREIDTRRVSSVLWAPHSIKTAQSRGIFLGQLNEMNDATNLYILYILNTIYTHILKNIEVNEKYKQKQIIDVSKICASLKFVKTNYEWKC